MLKGWGWGETTFPNNRNFASQDALSDEKCPHITVQPEELA
jgi:hypothetical protein